MHWTHFGRTIHLRIYLRFLSIYVSIYFLKFFLSINCRPISPCINQLYCCLSINLSSYRSINQSIYLSIKGALYVSLSSHLARTWLNFPNHIAHANQRARLFIFSPIYRHIIQSIYQSIDLSIRGVRYLARVR